MQLAAPWFAERILEAFDRGEKVEGIFSTSFLDVAVLRSMLARRGRHLPLALYFHENQFAYPVRGGPNDMFQFTAINFNSGLCADKVAFNSQYNRDSFLKGVSRYLKKAVDMEVAHLVDDIREKSTILYPGMDYGFLDGERRREPTDRTPVIVWNHRWEHDKGPESFFAALEELDREGLAFRVMVLGENFERVPEVFGRAEKKLAHRFVHFGYAPSRERYGELLQRADIVVSTAKHEFFGIAVLEAVRAGCRPLVPDRLSYRELFPKKYRYRSGELTAALRALLHRPVSLAAEERRRLTARYCWSVMAEKYRAWLIDSLG